MYLLLDVMMAGVLWRIWPTMDYQTAEMEVMKEVRKHEEKV